MHTKVSKYIKQSKKYISITKKSDMSITVIYQGISLTVLYLCPYAFWVIAGNTLKYKRNSEDILNRTKDTVKPV